jgi:hypothetical protein
MTNDKRKLKRDYKEQRRSMGVFQIRNLQNDHIFVASSLNLDAALNRHRFQLEHGSASQSTASKGLIGVRGSSICFRDSDEITPTEKDPDRDRSSTSHSPKNSG